MVAMAGAVVVVEMQGEISHLWEIWW